MSLSDVGAYIVAQVVGAIGGAVLANVMFSVGQHVSTSTAPAAATLVGEIVVTAGLIALIFALARSYRGAVSAPAVGGFIGMRLIGLVAGLGVLFVLYPDAGSAALETAVAQASTAITVTPADFADDFAQV